MSNKHKVIMEKLRGSHSINYYPSEIELFLFTKFYFDWF